MGLPERRAESLLLQQGGLTLSYSATSSNQLRELVYVPFKIIVSCVRRICPPLTVNVWEDETHREHSLLRLVTYDL